MVVASAFGSLGQNHNDHLEAALALDISRRLVADYRKDKRDPASHRVRDPLFGGPASS